jgi:putative pyruvate formate lyase activating enzyme
MEIFEIQKRSQLLKKRLSSCDICPRNCKVNRLKGQRGFCKATSELEVAHIGLHYGEEPPFSGKNGSGAIFFAHCNLRCVYCQNWQISQPDKAHRQWVTTPQKLAKKMIKLQTLGAHNINLVSPTQFTPQILECLYHAFQMGLKIPIIYNTNGYDSVEILQIFDGIVDIYLPDCKYSEDTKAFKYSSALSYTEANQKAIKEMFRQVGNLKVNLKGIAEKGLLVRHLVLPNKISDSIKCLDFLRSISQDITISLMAQYNPLHKAKKYFKLNRPITQEEYKEVIEYSQKIGLTNVYIQEIESINSLIPDFEKEKPFEEKG